MRTTIQVIKSKKTGNNYLCMMVGDVMVFLNDIQLMKILKMNPYEIASVKAIDGFIYDITEERRLD